MGESQRQLPLELHGRVPKFKAPNSWNGMAESQRQLPAEWHGRAQKFTCILRIPNFSWLSTSGGVECKEVLLHLVCVYSKSIYE